MALLQSTIDDDIKKRADAVFARNGLTTAMAVRVTATQVANTGKDICCTSVIRGTAHQWTAESGAV